MKPGSMVRLLQFTRVDANRCQGYIIAKLMWNSAYAADFKICVHTSAHA